MIYDYSKLRGKIIEKCGTQTKFQELMKLSHTSISDKLNNKIDFTQEDIEKAIEILNIKRADISIYFFNLKV